MCNFFRAFAAQTPHPRGWVAEKRAPPVYDDKGARGCEGEPLGLAGAGDVDFMDAGGAMG